MTVAMATTGLHLRPIPTARPERWVVTGYDGSPGTAAALVEAAHVARARDASLAVAVTAVPEDDAGLTPHDCAGCDTTERARLRNEVGRLLDGARCPWELRVHAGSLTDAIDHAARELAAEIVVVGAARGRLSGVPAPGRLVRRLHRPVLVVPAGL